jgi:hypothetical protein
MDKDKSLKELLEEMNDQYQTFYDAISNMKLKVKQNA